jgi:hypothetical protein
MYLPGEGPGDIFDFRFYRTMRHLKGTPVRRYLLALERHPDSPHTEQLRQEALAYVTQLQAEVERELFELEYEYPELANEVDEHDDDN